MIKKTPLSERPRERCLEAGPACLSLRECLALILGSGPPGIGCLGVASQVLERPGPGFKDKEMERAFFTAMEVSSSAYLKEVPGLGPAGQAKILAAFELGRRYSLYKRSYHPNNPGSHHTGEQSLALPKLATQALHKVSQQQRAAPQEWLGFVPFHRSGELGELCLVERGVRTHVNIDPAELFARVLSLRPRGFFLFHNHPSGILNPSLQDLELTEKVAETSNQFGILLLGHWIVTDQGEKLIES